MTRPSAQSRERNAAGGGYPPDGPAGRRDARSRWRAFAGRYGWRAYALPLLTAISVVAIFNIGTHPDPPAARAVLSTPALSTQASPPASGTSRPTAVSSKPATSKPATSTPASSVTRPLPLPALPPGAPYSFSAQGTFSILAGASGVLGKGGQLYRFTIDVEDGVTGADPKAFAAGVMNALSDQRSWIGNGAVSLQRVDSGPVDFRITLAAPATLRPVCGYSLRVETSCYAGGEGRVMLNVSRWVRGAQVFGADLANYRRYAVNHEVGHAIGHNHAHYCLDSGLAPVMMQQSLGNKTAGGRACRANPWPFPPGVPDAPGAEQVGDAADAEFFQRNSS
ncbi:MAG TPA: DUF3152 domain-containing protein [Jatrophihabitans sp.]|uniref:DUF3152 domain-containing protein n=1 Tax=Jatrophihabitans sp. TaxID=1932789 RepID=UPI002F231093